MRGLNRALSKFVRREYATDVTSASRIQHILSPGTVLPLWGLSDADGVLGYITVDDNKIDIGGSAFIVGGKMADGYKVALKVFTTPMHDYQVTLIRRELATVRKLAPHPNILSFLGTCPHQNAVLVSPLMCNGNLLRYLERNPATDRHKLVVQVAEALCHVHDVLKLVHGDLKCENVLISDEGHALLADFGLSTAIEKAASDVTTVSDIRQKSTLRFNAPELMLDQVEQVDARGRFRVRSKTTATDMYAFGMLILQAFTSQRPWPQLRHEMQIITTVCYARRMHPRPDAQSHAVAAGFTDQHWDICSSCWNFEPQDRPKIRHVLSALVQSTIREDPMWSGVRALEYDPTYRTSSRPERNEAITSERAALSPPTNPTPTPGREGNNTSAWYANAAYYQQYISQGTTPDYGSPNHSRHGSVLRDETDPYRPAQHSASSLASPSFHNVNSTSTNPLVLAPFNASAKSVLSARSSYHSEHGGDMEEKLYALLHPGTKKRKWDDFAGEIVGVAKIAIQLDDREGTTEHPAEDILINMTGLTKEDIVMIQRKLLDAALQTKSTVDAPPSRPPSLRRRRSFIGQTMSSPQSPSSRTISPGPLSPYVSPKNSVSPFNSSSSAPPLSSLNPLGTIAPSSASSPPYSSANLTGSDTEWEKTPAPRQIDRSTRTNALLTYMMESIDRPAKNFAPPVAASTRR